MPKKDIQTTEERYVCEECGTEVPTAEEVCPNCGAPLEKFGDHPGVVEEEDDVMDLSDEALHKGLPSEEDDGAPLSLEALREEEDSDDELDAYEKGQNDGE